MGMCCGMMFDSRGNKPAANMKAHAMEDVLKEISLNGRMPIICDTSPCTQTMKNKLQDKKLAGMCAENVHESGIPCCGMAGDRGMRYEELTKSSLQHLEVPSGCSDGYSTSRTCEMSLSRQSDVNFRGLLYLIDDATTAKAATGE